MPLLIELMAADKIAAIIKPTRPFGTFNTMKKEEFYHRSQKVLMN